jgi:hypothetical protein
MLAGLGRFRERLVDLPAKRVRAVGTDTFRRVKQPKDLLARASSALGFPIEVLPGGEEARLIYLGVAHEEPAIEGRRLVLDIGGGSTECILGKRFAPILKDSLAMGCVNFTRRFFDDGRFTRKAFRKAEVAAALEFETLQRRYQEAGWEECIGASGTIVAVSEIVRENGWSEGALTLGDVKRLRRALIAAEGFEKADLPGLAAERAQVLGGGLAILKAAFETLEIESLRATRAALREGVLTTSSAASVTRTCATGRSARCPRTTTWAPTRPSASSGPRAAVSTRWRRPGSSSPRARRSSSAGPRACTRSGSLSHSGHHKHGGYILETPTCRASRARTSSPSRPWCAPTGASSRAPPSPSSRGPRARRSCACACSCASPCGCTARARPRPSRASACARSPTASSSPSRPGSKHPLTSATSRRGYAAHGLRPAPARRPSGGGRAASLRCSDDASLYVLRHARPRARASAAATTSGRCGGAGGRQRRRSDAPHAARRGA